jgi:hypothetical protein
MYVAGPINNADEARMLEQAAYLTDLRTRTHPTRRRTAEASTRSTTPRPTLFPH